MRSTIAVIFALVVITSWMASQGRTVVEPLNTDRANDLISEIRNEGLSASDRDRALSSLEKMDFERAVGIAPALLTEEDGILRFRAAWILASGKQDLGVNTLRAVAGERSEYSSIAMKALGRLRDPGSHQLLRSLLEKELATLTASDTSVFLSSLAWSLAEYGDREDTDLLARAVSARFKNDHVLVDALGRTGGGEAIPVLEEIFSRSGKGWTVMAAGLALARCGSPKGISYVKRWLIDSSADPNKPNESYPTNGETDNPHSVKAADFLRSRLGVPADEIFVPELLQIVTQPEYSHRAKAKAWTAFVRMNPEKSRKDLLKLAWENTAHAGAVKLIVLNAESEARAFVDRFGEVKDRGQQAIAFELRIALSKSPRERLRWRELHGYAF